MGKVKSVTNANVAEFVNDRKALGSDVKTEEQVKQEDAKAKAAKPAETPQPQEGIPTAVAEADKQKPKNSVQERIDELTRQKKELEEFAQTEYEARSQAQRRITELEAQIKAEQSPPPPKDKPAPDPEKYTDQKLFLKDWGEWNRKQAIKDFQADAEKQRQEDDNRRLLAEANARRQKSLDSARKDFPDWDEKIGEAARSVEAKQIASPTVEVQRLLIESDYQAHILYHLAAHPEEVAKLNGMRPAQVAIAIGRLEKQFEKPGDTTTTTLKPNLPEPIPALGTGSGTVPADMTTASFQDYKRRRLDEIRKNRARRG